jgi:hypothetical protein
VWRGPYMQGAAGAVSQEGVVQGGYDADADRSRLQEWCTSVRTEQRLYQIWTKADRTAPQVAGRVHQTKRNEAQRKRQMKYQPRWMHSACCGQGCAQWYMGRRDRPAPAALARKVGCICSSHVRQGAGAAWQHGSQQRNATQCKSCSPQSCSQNTAGAHLQHAWTARHATLCNNTGRPARRAMLLPGIPDEARTVGGGMGTFKALAALAAACLSVAVELAAPTPWTHDLRQRQCQGRRRQGMHACLCSSAAPGTRLFSTQRLDSLPLHRRAHSCTAAWLFLTHVTTSAITQAR